MIKDVIYLGDVERGIDNLYYNGIEHGNSTFIPEVDEIFRWLKGNLIVFGGIANHGKSTFALYLMLLQSINKGNKWCIFSPESFPAEMFYSDLIRMYLQKSVIDGYGNKASAMELRKAKDFIGNHFFNVYPEEESPTPKLIFDTFQNVINKHKVDGCVVDPFNQLDNDWRSEGRDDLYISKFLTSSKRFAQKNNIYQIIVAHPKIMKKDGLKDYPAPDLYDFHGGSMWSSKADDIVIIHRPTRTTDPKDTTVHVTSIKIKRQPYCGITGTVVMNYNAERHCYNVSGKSMPPIANYYEPTSVQCVFGEEPPF